MKPAISLLLLALMFSSESFAQVSTMPSPGQGGPPAGSTASDMQTRQQKREAEQQPEKRDVLKIRGECVILPNDSNPLTGPCNTVLLILNDLGGKEVSRTRTDATGYFEFSPTAEQKGPFLLASGARFFQPTKPKALVKPGQDIRLEMDQK